jgi:uncharacterized membrane protein
MTPLPTLGGNNSSAIGDNNLGQVVGFAETGDRDKRCVAPQRLGIKAVVYEPVVKSNSPVFYQPHELPPLQGDAIGVALGINNNGDVVGLSGGCFVPDYQNLPAVARHAVLWRNGRVPWIPERSATRLRKADLNILSKLGNQGLEWRPEPEAFTGREVRREDDLLDFLVGCPVDIEVARQPSA